MPQQWVLLRHFQKRAMMMEFGEKLQQLRRKRGLTQEELAGALYVSRTAVSKWESGRGYPNIDSLKAIARFFGVTIDDLLSGGEMLTLAEEDSREQEARTQNQVFGLLDAGCAMFLFLPLFGYQEDGTVHMTSLLSPGGLAPYMKAAYILLVVAITAAGVLTLTLRHERVALWQRHKRSVSLALGAVGALLLIAGRQVYAAAIVFIFLVIKALVFYKKP